ncbi:MAG: tyrosine-type recombinase/integrase [Planctomycetota bacterium]|jgi:integrase
MTIEGTIKGGLRTKKTSKWWYARYQIDGKRKEVNLRVEIKGTRPELKEEHGDVAFEKSKVKAEMALQKLLSELNSNKNAVDSAQAVHVAVTGRKATVHSIDDLKTIWDRIPRKKRPDQKQVNTAHLHIDRFVGFVQKNYPQVHKLDHVTEDMAQEWLSSDEIARLANGTWNKHLSTLKGLFKRSGATAFDYLIEKEKDVIHRVPFSPEELADVLNACMEDEMVYQLAVVASCTAMRKGDCCLLKWEHIDLDEGWVTVKTSKTGQTVDIPISKLLRKVVSEQIDNGSEYVFPQLAGQYDLNPSLLTRRFKRCLAKIGFVDGAPAKQLLKIDDYETADLLAKAEGYFESIITDQKRDKARRALDAYLKFKSVHKAGEVVGTSKGTISLYMNEIEQYTGIAFMVGKPRNMSKAVAVPERGMSTLTREQGVQKASVRDFHAFRTTWITIALIQGLPMKLVQLISGHSTADIVVKNYFKPQRAELRKALEKCMPDLLTAGKVSTPLPDEVRMALQSMNAGNWEEIRDQLLKG